MWLEFEGIALVVVFVVSSLEVVFSQSLCRFHTRRVGALSHIDSRKKALVLCLSSFQCFRNEPFFCSLLCSIAMQATFRASPILCPQRLSKVLSPRCDLHGRFQTFSRGFMSFHDVPMLCLVDFASLSGSSSPSCKAWPPPWDVVTFFVFFLYKMFQRFPYTLHLPDQ